MADKNIKTIYTRELVSLFLLTSAYKITDMTPTLLMKDGENSAWVIPIISAVITFGYYFIFSKVLISYKNKNLIDITKTLTGKFIGAVLGVLFTGISFGGIFLTSRNSIDILNVMFFPKTPKLALLIATVGASYIIARLGFKNVARMAWLFTPVNTFILLLYVVLSFKEIKFAYLFPIGGVGIWELIKSGIIHTSVLGEVFLFTIFYSIMNNEKDYRNGTYMGIGFTGIFMSVFTAIYIMIYDYPLIEQVAFPFQQITTFLSLGQYITNVESFFLGFWAVAFLIRTAIYLHVVSTMFTYTLGLKDPNRVLLSFATLVVIVGLVPDNSAQAVLMLRDQMLQWIWIVFVGIPFVFYLLLKLRKGEVQK